MKNSLILILSLQFLFAVYTPETGAQSRTPKHPSQIKYEKLDWEIPLGSPYRTTLSNGLRLYIAEDHALPLVTIDGLFKTGTIIDPDGKEGLGAFTVHLMRTGGTEKFQSAVLDALIDHFAISLSFNLSDTQLGLKMQFLSQFTDTALAILEQVLFHPAFEELKIEKERAIALQRIEHRFDNPEPLLGSAYARNMYCDGENSRLSTKSSVSALTRKELIGYHSSVFKTGNVILGVSGDIDKNSILKKLEKIFPKAGKDSVKTAFPAIEVKQGARFLVVHKDLSQAYVRLGLPLFRRPHPDFYPISIFDYILGSGSFTSRLVATIRSDHGLTYSISSRAESNYIYPGTFFISFFTKYETLNKAVDLTLQEVAKILKDGVTDEELANAKKGLIDVLPSMFRSKEDIVGNYTWNEYYGRPEDQFKVYPDKINAITKKEILEAAKRHIDPSHFTYVIVGDTTRLFKTEKSGDFQVDGQKDMKIITPEMLYSPDLFSKSK